MLRIAHFCPFAPNRAGIYEAARDMVRADNMRGHDAFLIDLGPTRDDGTKEPPIIGAIDDRGGFRLTTMPPERADNADVLVCHSGVPDNWIVKTLAPMVWIVHGRPLDAFRPEQQPGGRISYSIYHMVGQWPRTRKMVYFWPQYDIYWCNVLPVEKLVRFPWPAIDMERFGPEGPVHQFAARGKWNGVICDSWRWDMDVFEIANGAVEAARRNPGLMWHFYAMEHLPPWEHIFRALRGIGALGEVYGRRADMEQLYRAADLVLTPHHIVTRIVGEAQAVGTPVVTGQGCLASRWQAKPDDPNSVANTITALIEELEADRDAVRREALANVAPCNLHDFGARMEGVYLDAMRG